VEVEARGLNLAWVVGKEKYEDLIGPIAAVQKATSLLILSPDDLHNNI
jgi:hypothetical protein